MALRGVRIVTTDGEKERTVVEVRLLRDGTVDLVSGEPARFHAWKRDGLRPHRNDIPLLNDLGAEYAVEFHAPKGDERYLPPVRPEDGSRFLILLLAQHARGTYTRAEPVED